MQDASKDELEYVPSVTISRFQEVLNLLYRVREVPALVISNTGIGKTQTVKQFCGNYNLDYKNIRLSYMEAQDIVGFPQVKEDSMVFIQPDFLPKEPGSRGVLFFDEINRARIDVLQAVFQLILERELGVGHKHKEIYKLPDDWFIIAAQNPDSDEYYVSPMDSALYNRFLIIPIEYDETSYKDFVYKKREEYHSSLHYFIQEKDIAIHDPGLHKVALKPTPRSFELFNKVIKKMLPGEFHLLDIIGNGLIGPGNFKNFNLFLLDDTDMIKDLLKAILNGDFEKKPKKVQQLEQEQLHLIIGICDRFVTDYVRDSKKFEEIKDGPPSLRFLNFLFNLSNEHIVAACLGIKKEMDRQDRGAQYMGWLQDYLMGHEQANTRYEEIITVHQELKMEYYI